MKIYLSLIACFVFVIALHSQDGGLRVYAGISSLTNKDKIANPDGFSHTGYHIGVDGRLMSGGMSFLVGGRYTSVSKIPLKDFKLTDHQSTLSLINGRVGLGISLYSFSNIFRIRTKALGSFDLVMNQSGPDLPPQGYVLNDGWLGFVTGLGADIGPATIDLEYEIGVINGYNKVKTSTFNSFTVSVGFFF